MNCAIHPCPVCSLNGRKKNIIPNEVKVFETEKQQSLSWKGGYWQGDWAACHEQWDDNSPEKCNLRPLHIERSSHSVTVARLFIIKLDLSIVRQMKNLCLQRELKPLSERGLEWQATCNCRIGNVRSQDLVKRKMNKAAKKNVNAELLMSQD